MLFSSITFLCLFLPLVISIYYLCPRKLRNAFLLLASIIFYAWGEPRYLLIMFAIIIINYIGALLISKDEKISGFWLFLTVSANIAFLGYFKYFNFIIENINAALKTSISLWNIALPLGISFYTFQALSYTIDVYKKTVQPQKSLYKLALYISLFPQLIAGPIVKYHDIVEQIDNRKESLDQVYYGVRRFIIGLAKKVLIANILGGVADKIIAQISANNGVETPVAWLGGISGALQVYYDFSGYSDMAIGLGAIFGFKFMENFNYPYISKTMGEYWKRWHISLGTWCKDYIYIPMGGSRVATWRIYFNLFFLFFIIGLWHGASWNFIVFGILNALCVMFERATNMQQRKLSWIILPIQRLSVILMFILNTVLGNSNSLGQALKIIKSMLGLQSSTEGIFGLPYYVERVEIICLVIALLCCAPICKNMLEWGKKHQVIRIGIDIWLLALLLMSFSQIAVSSYNPFIYFRF